MGCSDRRFQEVAVPEPKGTPVLADLISLELQHVFDVKEFRVQSASSFKAARWIVVTFFFAARTRAL